MPFPPAARAALAAAAVLAASPFGASLARAADGWSAGADGTAGFSAGGRFAGLWIACAGGGAGRLFVSTGGRRLASGVDHTVAVTVDDTAFLQRLRAGEAAGEAVLAGRLDPTATRALAEALAKGRRLEIAMPAGRFTLPLKGSGRAMQGFSAACR